MACHMPCLPTDEEGTMREDRRPIGYWLKHLDGLIEAAFERTLAGQGVTRRHWQALNTLQERPSTQAAIADALAPVPRRRPGSGSTGDRRARGPRLGRAGVGSVLKLTPVGTEVHAGLLARIQAMRQRLMRGVTQEEYLVTVDVLRRMAGNLERGEE